MKTYQDLQAAEDKAAFILEAIREHKTSVMYRMAFDAEEYDHRRNVTILRYQKLLYTLTGEAIPDRFTANHKLCSNFFNRFITQQNQYLLGNGVNLTSEPVKVEEGTPGAVKKIVYDRFPKDPYLKGEYHYEWYLNVSTGEKEKLGEDFDDRLQEAGRAALVQGLAFGFWDLDQLRVFKLTEFVPLWDENTGALMAGIRFWQLDENKPMRAILFELDGYTEYRKEKSGFAVSVEKRNYIQITRQSEADGIEAVEGLNYPGLPIVPLWGNPLHQSELVGLREDIDCYDLIKSGFANDLDDASMIYWTLQNSGGMDDIDLAKFVERMKTLKASTTESGVTAEAHTIEVPYQSRVAYLDRLEQDMYNDAQILNVTALSAAQKTATEINAAYTPMDLKTDQYEYCVRDFLRGIFSLAGVKSQPTFKRNRIQNELEVTQMVLMAAQYLDTETLLNHLPWLTPEEVEHALDQRDETEAKRFSALPNEQLLEGVNTDGDAANA